MERDARLEVAPVGAEVDAAENDFAKTRFREASDFVDRFIRRKAARSAADEGNHAKGAAAVAAILNFENRASVV